MTEISDTTLPSSLQANCTNCGVPLSGKFCHDCGQSSRSMIKFFGEVLKELLDDILGYDSRFKHSVLPLLLKPGQLTLEYIKGRRFYYVMPFRLYLITSILFIFVVQLNVDYELPINNSNELSIEDKQELKQDMQQMMDEFGDSMSEPEKQRLLNKIENINQPVLNQIGQNSDEPVADEEKNKKNNGPNLKWVDGKPVYQPWEVEEEGPIKMLADEINTKAPKWLKDPKPLFDELFEIAPYMMLFLIPIFAIFQKLFYAFSKRYYIEHLIFSLHNHSFLYIALLGSIATENITDSLRVTEGVIAQSGYYIFGILDVLIAIWIFLYIFIATKRVYQQGWLLTISKTLVLGLMYFILSIFGLVSTILIGIYLAN